MAQAKTSDLSQTNELDAQQAFGSEVRQLRKARRMTLTELAKASGVSVSHLSAIERGTVNASLSKISRIAAALAVPEEWFFARRSGKGPMERAYVVRQKNRRDLNMLYEESIEQAGYSDQLLSSSIGGSFYLGVSEYGPRTEQVVDHYYSRDGELHGVVLDGELELVLGDEVIPVKTGDSFSFPGDILHTVRNASDQPARLIFVNAPMIIPKYVALKPDETESEKESG